MLKAGAMNNKLKYDFATLRSMQDQPYGLELTINLQWKSYTFGNIPRAQLKRNHILSLMKYETTLSLCDASVVI